MGCGRDKVFSRLLNGLQHKFSIKSKMGRSRTTELCRQKPGGQKEFYKRPFTMEQWGKCCVTVRNMENMLLNTAGSGINKSQTQTIKNIKVVYHVPTPFSSVVCYKENLLLNGIQFWLNYQRHFPHESHSLTCVINSSLAILIYFYHREIGAELEGNSKLHFSLLFRALIPLIFSSSLLSNNYDGDSPGRQSQI